MLCSEKEYPFTWNVIQTQKSLNTELQYLFWYFCSAEGKQKQGAEPGTWSTAL